MATNQDFDDLIVRIEAATEILEQNASGGEGDGIPEAPIDGLQYARQDATWTVVQSGGGGIPDAPSDGEVYGRQDGDWVIVPSGGGGDAVWGGITGVLSNQSDLSTALNDAATTATWTGVTGKPAVIAAGANQVQARNQIGAGTSNLELGSTSSTAKAGNWLPNRTEITGTSSTIQDFLAATSAATARTAIGATNLTIGTTASTAKAGNYQPTWTQVTGKPTFGTASESNLVTGTSDQTNSSVPTVAWVKANQSSGGGSGVIAAITATQGTQIGAAMRYMANEARTFEEIKNVLTTAGVWMSGCMARVNTSGTAPDAPPLGNGEYLLEVMYRLDSGGEPDRIIMHCTYLGSGSNEGKRAMIQRTLTNSPSWQIFP